MTLNLEQVWLKAAVEHRLVTISYQNPDTRLVYTKRDIRPVGLGMDRNGRPCLWGVLDHNPHVGVKSFHPDHFEAYQLTPRKFEADPQGEWQQLVDLYKEHKLDEIEA